ncbi:CFAP298 family protein, partial [Candidatus Dependentiae bacterium]|nr:CFAP298 family protein [Candidatus Dependentiae bacterium]
KIVVRLQKSGAGAPVREPAVDEETYKKMLSYYYKKQEEQKKLEEDNDDHYMNSAWADPKNLKNQLHGGQEIKWKPFK